MAEALNTHLEGDVNLAYVAAGYTVLDDMHLDAPFKQIERGLEDADMRFDTKDDDMLNVTSTLEPLVGDVGEVHAEFGLWMHRTRRDVWQFLEEIAQRRDGGSQRYIARKRMCQPLSQRRSCRIRDIPLGFCSVVKTGTSRILAALSMRAEVFVTKSKLAMAVLNLSCISHRKNAVFGSSMRAVRKAVAAAMVAVDGRKDGSW